MTNERTSGPQHTGALAAGGRSARVIDAAGATAAVGDMVGDDRRPRREVDHLAGHGPDHLRVGEILPAVFAAHRLIVHGHIRVAARQVLLRARRAACPAPVSLCGRPLAAPPASCGPRHCPLTAASRSSSSFSLTPPPGGPPGLARRPPQARRALFSDRSDSLSDRRTATAAGVSSTCWRSVDPTTPRF